MTKSQPQTRPEGNPDPPPNNQRPTSQEQTDNDNPNNTTPINTETLNNILSSIRNFRQDFARDIRAITTRLDNAKPAARNTTSSGPIVLQFYGSESVATLLGAGTTSHTAQGTQTEGHGTPIIRNSVQQGGNDEQTQPQSGDANHATHTPANPPQAQPADSQEQLNREPPPASAGTDTATLEEIDRVIHTDQLRMGTALNLGYAHFIHPLPSRGNFRGRLQAGYDRPLPGSHGRWEYLSSGEDGTSEQLAITNLGSQGYWPHDTARPTAMQVYELRQRMHRDIENGTQAIDVTDGIDIVWVIEEIGDVHAAEELNHAVELVDPDERTSEVDHPAPSEGRAEKDGADVVSEGTSQAQVGNVDSDHQEDTITPDSANEMEQGAEAASAGGKDAPKRKRGWILERKDENFKKVGVDTRPEDSPDQIIENDSTGRRPTRSSRNVSLGFGDANAGRKGSTRRNSALPPPSATTTATDPKTQTKKASAAGGDRQGSIPLSFEKRTAGVTMRALRQSSLPLPPGEDQNGPDAAGTHRTTRNGISIFSDGRASSQLPDSSKLDLHNFHPVTGVPKRFRDRSQEDLEEESESDIEDLRINESHKRQKSDTPESQFEHRAEDTAEGVEEVMTDSADEDAEKPTCRKGRGKGKRKGRKRKNDPLDSGFSRKLR